MTYGDLVKKINGLQYDSLGAMIGSAVGSLGQGIGTLEDAYAATGVRHNPSLESSVVGNTWGDVFNNAYKLSQGYRNVDANITDYSNVLNNQNIYDISNPNEYQRNIQYKQTGPLGAMFSDAGKFATAGSMFGPIGTGIGAGLGLLSGYTRSLISDFNNKHNTARLNDYIDRSNLLQAENKNNAMVSNQMRDIRNNMRNYFDDGGSLSEQNDVTRFNVGGSHEENPYQGIMQGYGSDGNPNYVEEGEVKFNDYIYSDRLKATKEVLQDNILPEKYKNMSFAKIAEKIQRESEDRPNDPISKRSLEEMMDRLANAQEQYKEQIEQRNLADMIDSLPEEQKAALAYNMMAEQEAAQQQQMQQEYPEDYYQGQDMYGQPQMMADGGYLDNFAHLGAYGMSLTNSPYGISPDYYPDTDDYVHHSGGNPYEYLYPYYDDNGNMRDGKIGIEHIPLFDDVERLPRYDYLQGLDYGYPLSLEKSEDIISGNTLPYDDIYNSDSNEDDSPYGNLLRFAPAIGSAIGTLFNRPDFTYANALQQLSGLYQPISAPTLGGYRRYYPYDINLMNNQAMAQLAANQRANYALGNRGNQVAGNIAMGNAYSAENAMTNLNYQKANEANKLATDQYNLGIDQANLNAIQSYDQMNMQNNANKVNALANAAKARDEATTLASTNNSTSWTNTLNNLGNIGKDLWSYNQVYNYFKNLGWDNNAIIGLLGSYPKSQIGGQYGTIF